MRSKIYLRNDILEKCKTCAEAISVYCILCADGSSMNKDFVDNISIPVIASKLYGRKCSDYEVNTIRRGYDFLISNNIIEESYRTSIGNIGVKLYSMMFNQTDNWQDYMAIDLEDVLNVFQKINRGNRYKALQLFIFLFSYSDNRKRTPEEFRKKFYSLGRIYAQKKLKWDKKTIIKYIQLLEDAKIIYYLDIGGMFKSGIYRLRNVCCKYENKDKVFDYLKSICPDVTQEDIKIFKQAKRSMYIYNNLNKETDESYSIKDLLDLIEYMCFYNESHIEDPLSFKNVQKYCKKNSIDLSVYLLDTSIPEDVIELFF